MENKITVRLISGIGNNLYQIATLYHLAKQNKISNWSVIYPQHDGKIQEIRPHGGHYTPKIDNIPFFIEDVFPNVNWKDSCDIDDFVISSYIFDLLGFWESIDEIRQILKPSPKITEYIDEKYQEIFNKKTIGMHFRFTSGSDSFPPEKNIAEWNLDILQKESSEYENIIIISNHYSFAKKIIDENFKSALPDKSIYLIENESNYVDMFLLSKCDLIICSNSTFSFWSAALSENAKRIYMTPEYKPANCKNSIPSEWYTNREIFYKYYNN